MYIIGDSKGKTNEKSMIGLNSEVETAMKTIKGTLFLIKQQQKKKKSFY